MLLVSRVEQEIATISGTGHNETNIVPGCKVTLDGTRRLFCIGECAGGRSVSDHSRLVIKALGLVGEIHTKLSALGDEFISAGVWDLNV